MQKQASKQTKVIINNQVGCVVLVQNVRNGGIEKQTCVGSVGRAAGQAGQGRDGRS